MKSTMNLFCIYGIYPVLRRWFQDQAIHTLYITSSCSWLFSACRRSGAGLSPFSSLCHQELPQQWDVHRKPAARTTEAQLSREVEWPVQIQAGEMTSVFTDLFICRCLPSLRFYLVRWLKEEEGAPHCRTEVNWCSLFVHTLTNMLMWCCSNFCYVVWINNINRDTGNCKLLIVFSVFPSMWRGRNTSHFISRSPCIWR